MAALAIRWINKESKNYLDILPVPFFRFEVRESEVEHKIKGPNGKSYAVKCKLNVKDEIATLTYKQTDNRPNSIWPGVTRITFATAGRTEVRLVETLRNPHVAEPVIGRRFAPTRWLMRATSLLEHFLK
jgi:hypothetical protein